VTLKHDCKRYLEPCSLAVLCEDVHSDDGEFVEKALLVSSGWSRRKKITLFIYEVGNADRQTFPRYVLSKAEITRDGARFALSLAEEQWLSC